MQIPNQPKTPITPIRIPADLKEQVKALAELEATNLSQVVISQLRSYVDESPIAFGPPPAPGALAEWSTPTVRFMLEKVNAAQVALEQGAASIPEPATPQAMYVDLWADRLESELTGRGVFRLQPNL